MLPGKKKPLPFLTPINENSIIITWPEIICQIQHQEIIHCQQMVTNVIQPYLIETVLSYNSLMIYYHYERIALAHLISQLQEIINEIALKRTLPNKANSTSEKTIEIPVYYGKSAGWDIEEVALRLSLTVEQVIELHSNTTYRAYALGFTPGFCYLGSLSTQLQLPRRSSPRVKIAKGAVAIAELQTAVYPNTSPGGWHILGQTPVALYDVISHNSSTSIIDSEKTVQRFIPKIEPGKSVKFTAIDYDSFCKLGGILEQDPNA